MSKSKKIFQYLADGSIDTTAWLEKIKNIHEIHDVTFLNKACTLTKKISNELTPFYGTSFLEQGLKIAEIILDLKLDQESIAAAIIVSIPLSTKATGELIKKELNANVLKLVLGVQQMEMISSLQKQKKNNPSQTDKISKMLLAMANDIRVVIIKLAERLCLMQSIKHLLPEERKRYAEEVLDIYAPLANRLGIGKIKWELEDIAFHYLDPTTYKTIANFLAEKRVDREMRITHLISTLQEKLQAQSVSCKVAGRAKHIYSIYSKMKLKNLSHQDIYDYLAIRILTLRVQDCYTSLSLVHSLWTPLIAEFDDYIANPKSNGYRSIHTAVIGEDDQHFEIQIRTHDMHEEAEHGVAAHWLYKENKAHADDTTKITYLRQLLNWHQEIAEPDLTETSEKTLFFDNKIYVITPKGDILDLPFGATPLDFAYHIHSDLGHRCRGAKVNAHIVPLCSMLRTGDKVEIFSIGEGGPSRDWLNAELGYVKTSTAKRKILNWFKRQTTNRETGEEKTTPPRRKIKKIPPSLDLQLIEKRIQENVGAAIFDSAHLLMRFAKCCNPTSEDLIIGYITQGRGVSVHKKNCNNIKKAANQNRLMSIHWNNKNNLSSSKERREKI